ncbi:MAG: tetratricopeptide repeat protein [Akkermansiaceae bacterium]
MTHLRHLIGLIFAALLINPVWAQTPEELANLDPGGLYYQAWSLVKQAEELEEEGEFVESFTKYRKARSFFDLITINHPAFKQKEGLKWRTKTTTEAMERIHPKALAQQKERQDAGKTPLLEVPGESRPPLNIPGKIDPTGSATKTIRNLQTEISRLNAALTRRANPRDAESARLRQKIRDFQSQLSRLAASPLRDQVTELNRQIEQLRQERDAMAAARDKALSDQRLTLQRLEVTQKALTTARREEERLKAVIAKQTKINSRVTEGQQDQIDALKATIKEKDRLMAESNRVKSELEARLIQSEKMVTELRLERNGLIEERDQMRVLLKMNEADRIQKLITQNVNLGKEFNEAKANLELVQQDSNTSKNKILLAKQALVVAKAKIQNLQKNNTQSKLRMDLLEKRLQQAEEDLLAQLNGGTLNNRGKEEVALLRGVIDKLKAKIQAQQGAAELLLKQGEKLGEKDAVWKEALARINGNKKMELTIEEMELIEKTTPLSPSLESNIAPSPEELAAGTSQLRAANKNLNAVARRLFSKGDFQASRGALELIVDQDPGAWEAMINLGIVQLRLDDPASAAGQFRQSILVAGDRKIPFAHFMLGDSLYRVELFEDAEQELRRSLSFEPQNSMAHILIGNIAGKTDRLDDAEFHYLEAIAQNPNLFEPYVNLAIINLRKGKKEEARKFYQRYLAKGGPARPALESRLIK